MVNMSLTLELNENERQTFGRHFLVQVQVKLLDLAEPRPNSTLQTYRAVIQEDGVVHEIQPRGLVRKRSERSTICVHTCVLVDFVGGDMEHSHGPVGADLWHIHVQAYRICVHGEGTWHVDMRLHAEQDVVGRGL